MHQLWHLKLTHEVDSPDHPVKHVVKRQSVHAQDIDLSETRIHCRNLHATIIKQDIDIGITYSGRDDLPDLGYSERRARSMRNTHARQLLHDQPL